MSTNDTPSVYTQPSGDADDVLGHSAAEQPVRNHADDDTAGHFRGTFAHDDKTAGTGEDDDTAGHFRGTFAHDDKTAGTDDDDVEGHRHSQL